MVASIKPHRDELGLADGRMLIDGSWVEASGAQTWSHRHMTKAIKAGTVGVNGYQLEPNSPFGGYRQSGMGREGGRAAIESYTELKTVLLPFTDEMM
jgi:acyl-CoA reductase-like NAD-dependent aldehyde dehydrogenase